MNSRTDAGRTRKRFTLAGAGASMVALVAVASCGGGDETSPSTTAAATPGAGDVGVVVDVIVGQAQGAGLEIDVQCVTSIVEQFGADDLESLTAGAADPSSDTLPPLSAEGEAIAEGLLDCVTGGEIGPPPTDSTDGSVPAETSPPATETVPTETAVEIPVGWPEGVPVPSDPLFYISADPAPPGEFVIVMREQTPGVFQSVIDGWAASLGLTCIVSLATEGPQICDGALPDGTTVEITVDQNALYSPQPRFVLRFVGP